MWTLQPKYVVVIVGFVLVAYFGYLYWSTQSSSQKKMIEKSEPAAAPEEEPVVQKTPEPESPYVFLDLGKEDYVKSPRLGRVVIKLWDQKVPHTSHNFRILCATKKYKETPFHRIIKDFMIQGGDFTRGDGSGGESIFGPTFPDEALDQKHDRPGLLSMANRGPDTNGSQFFITTAQAHHLDGKHVIFGEVISGMEFVCQLENEVTDSQDKPVRKCFILDCGVLPSKEVERSLAGETVQRVEEPRQVLSPEGMPLMPEQVATRSRKDDSESERHITWQEPLTSSQGQATSSPPIVNPLEVRPQMEGPPSGRQAPEPVMAQCVGTPTPSPSQGQQSQQTPQPMMAQESIASFPSLI